LWKRKKIVAKPQCMDIVCCVDCFKLIQAETPGVGEKLQEAIKINCAILN